MKNRLYDSENEGSDSSVDPQQWYGESDSDSRDDLLVSKTGQHLNDKTKNKNKIKTKTKTSPLYAREEAESPPEISGRSRGHRDTGDYTVAHSHKNDKTGHKNNKTGHKNNKTVHKNTPENYSPSPPRETYANMGAERGRFETRVSEHRRDWSPEYRETRVAKSYVPKYEEIDAQVDEERFVYIPSGPFTNAYDDTVWKKNETSNRAKMAEPRANTHKTPNIIRQNETTKQQNRFSNSTAHDFPSLSSTNVSRKSKGSKKESADRQIREKQNDIVTHKSNSHSENHTLNTTVNNSTNVEANIEEVEDHRTAEQKQIDEKQTKKMERRKKKAELQQHGFFYIIFRCEWKRTHKNSNFVMTVSGDIQELLDNKNKFPKSHLHLYEDKSEGRQHMWSGEKLKISCLRGDQKIHFGFAVWELDDNDDTPRKITDERDRLVCLHHVTFPHVEQNAVWKVSCKFNDLTFIQMVRVSNKGPYDDTDDDGEEDNGYNMSEYYYKRR